MINTWKYLLFVTFFKAVGWHSWMNFCCGDMCSSCVLANVRCSNSSCSDCQPSYDLCRVLHCGPIYGAGVLPKVQSHPHVWQVWGPDIHPGDQLDPHDSVHNCYSCSPQHNQHRQCLRYAIHPHTCNPSSIREVKPWVCNRGPKLWWFYLEWGK